MSLLTRGYRMALAGAVPLVLVACAESSVAPVQSTNAPRFGITTIPDDGGAVTVCKVANTGAPAQSFTFNWTRTTLVVGPNDGGIGSVGDETTGSFQLMPGECTDATDLATSPFGGGSLERIVIEEAALPSGWTLDDIDIVQGIPAAYTPPVPGTTDAFNVTDRTATIYINNDMSRRVTFEQTFTEEPPPPTIVCTRTIGYWKTRPHEAHLAANLPQTLGDAGPGQVVVTTVSQAQTILKIPVASNGIDKLKAQLLAAKLNGATSADPVIGSTVAAADAFLATHPSSSWSSLSGSEKSAVNALKDALDAWNNGETGPGHCD